MRNDLVVYTLAIGGDYSLPDINPQEGVDYLCFTDQETVDPNGWTTKKVKPLLPGDTFRSSRDFKIRPHRHLAQYSRSIYIDSSVRMLANPHTIWDALTASEDTVFGAMYHSYRPTLADEFAAVAKSKLDYLETLDEQWWTYDQHYPGLLEQQPVWGGVLARQHNAPECVAAMELWFSNILRYSRRDQLSLPLALGSVPEGKLKICDLDIRGSYLHEWPVLGKPRPTGYKIGHQDSWLVRQLRAYLRKKSMPPRRR